MNIEFKPFEFPSWEEFICEESVCFTIIDKSFNIYVYDNRIYAETTLYGGEDSDFELTREGYQQACDWLNKKKLELAQAFCG